MTDPNARPDPNAGGDPNANANAKADAAGGDAGKPWFDGLKLDDEVKAFVTGKAFPDVETALRSAMHADKVARDRNVLPKPAADKLADWEGWTELGWEKDFAKYQFGKAKVRDGVEYDQAEEEAFRKLAHEARVPLKAAEKLRDAIVEHRMKLIGEVDAEMAAEQQRLDEALRKEWGTSYDEKTEIARRAAKTLGVGVEEATKLTDLMGDAAMLKLFAKMGELLGEAKLVSDKGGTGRTPESARTELRRLQSEPEFLAALNDPRHPKHADVKAQREALLAEMARAA